MLKICLTPQELTDKGREIKTKSWEKSPGLKVTIQVLLKFGGKPMLLIPERHASTRNNQEC